MFEVRDKPEMVERALLVRLSFSKKDADEDISLLEELEELVRTLGIGVADLHLAHSRSMHRKYLCGTGKADEIVEYARAHECDCIVFDNELAPSQQREWEELAGICVIDREEVILDIFAQRAQTKEATLQVELARMQYALPRMARMWGHLDREGGGGTGGGGSAARGMGEQQIEVDRRLARKRIDRTKRELEAVRTQRATRRKDREKLDMALGAIVGYTNAGKSTLLNRISGSDIMAKDMLFATLDTTTRSIELPDGQNILLTDTVGFVRNLPHRLVEAFKATLEEAVFADFLIHVMDASSPEAEKFFDTTMHVLGELGAEGKPMITVLNKCDLVGDPRNIEKLKEKLKEKAPNIIVASAYKDIGIQELLTACSDILAERVQKNTYRIPQTQGQHLNQLHQEAKVLDTQYEANDVIITAIVPVIIAGRLQQFLVEE
ncbi:MAG: GTPase HflX [Akkermansiaceae bacterium]